MTPEFANATLPLVVYILKLFDRATAYKTGSAESERSLLRAEFEATAAKLRGPRAEEWELASYALAAVVDELLIVDIPWTGQSWWENHAFEVELFNTRRRATEFYSKADKAASFQSKEALSMFVLAVLVGFRGVLRDQPEQVETWLRSHIQSVRTAPETAVLPLRFSRWSVGGHSGWCNHFSAWPGRPPGWLVIWIIWTPPSLTRSLT
jgi:type VI protein secretion system component VasF